MRIEISVVLDFENLIFDFRILLFCAVQQCGDPRTKGKSIWICKEASTLNVKWQRQGAIHNPSKRIESWLVLETQQSSHPPLCRCKVLKLRSILTTSAALAPPAPRLAVHIFFTNYASNCLKGSSMYSHFCIFPLSIFNLKLKACMSFWGGD